jgi:hypothetical protein
MSDWRPIDLSAWPRESMGIYLIGHLIELITVLADPAPMIDAWLAAADLIEARVSDREVAWRFPGEQDVGEPVAAGAGRWWPGDAGVARACGGRWSVQVPAWKAAERDEGQIARWRAPTSQPCVPHQIKIFSRGDRGGPRRQGRRGLGAGAGWVRRLGRWRAGMRRLGWWRAGCRSVPGGGPGWWRAR